MYCTGEYLLKYFYDYDQPSFRISDPRISKGLKEAYKMQTISLEQYVAEIDKEEARMKGKFDEARMPRR